MFSGLRLEELLLLPLILLGITLAWEGHAGITTSSPDGLADGIPKHITSNPVLKFVGGGPWRILGREAEYD